MPRVRHWVHFVLALTLAAGAIWWVVPLVANTTWHSLGATLTSLSVPTLFLLTGLWAATLWAHSYVLTAGMPRLTVLQALTLKMAGSAVSNVAPCGGALGLGANLLMCRRWGFKDSQFAAFVGTTLLWDVTAKLLMPIAAIAMLTYNSLIPGQHFITIAWLSCAIVAATIGVATWTLLHDPSALAVSKTVQRVADRFTPRRFANTTKTVGNDLLTARDRSVAIVKTRWPRLTVATVAYLTFQGVLMATCLWAVGWNGPWPVLFAGFALERFLSLTFVTPGGVGVSEIGVIGTFATFGTDPGLAAAGVLLYRIFTFVGEIPVGALWVTVWWFCRSRV